MKETLHLYHVGQAHEKLSSKVDAYLFSDPLKDHDNSLFDSVLFVLSVCVPVLYQPNASPFTLFASSQFTLSVASPFTHLRQ